MDYSNLNKACPKDAYPLPQIDQLMDATTRHELLNFMDAYLGYNQIQMHPKDEGKMAFYMDDDIYCYKVMPFRLKKRMSHLPALG